MDNDIDWVLVDFDDGPKSKPLPAPAIAKKGTCPKCGKHIGRGVHFHEKTCKG